MKRTMRHLAVCAVGILSLVLCLIGCKRGNEYLELAELLAQSEMIHHPQLWTCDGAAKPKWEYTPTLMARSFVDL